MLLIWLTLFTSCVLADRLEVDSVTYIVKNSSELGLICSVGNTQAGVEVLVYDGSDGTLSFSSKNYSTLTVLEKREFMEVTLLSVNSSGLSPQAKNKTYNFIEEKDSTASAGVKYLKSDAGVDFATAAYLLRPFSGFVGIVLGVMSVFIFIMLGVVMASDLAYMVLPSVRIIGDRSDGERPRWVSREAFHAVKEAEGSTTYKGVLGMYLKLKIPLILGMSVCMTYLISGKVFDIIGFLVDAFG
jgi:hypothetical protein